MDCHVATLGKCTTTSVMKALEGSLVAVGLWVHHSDGLAHRFGDSFEAFLTFQILTFLVR